MIRQLGLDADYPHLLATVGAGRRISLFCFVGRDVFVFMQES
jgi:hypothetical protein